MKKEYRIVDKDFFFVTVENQPQEPRWLKRLWEIIRITLPLILFLPLVALVLLIQIRGRRYYREGGMMTERNSELIKVR